MSHFYKQIELDNWGCSIGCSTLSDSKHENELLVGTNEVNNIFSFFSLMLN